MFGKSDLVDSLNRGLARAHNKRDTLTSGVVKLTAQIAELEMRLSAKTSDGGANALRVRSKALKSE
jgi:outer membrane murein-binding lipoprotein Lpp